MIIYKIKGTLWRPKQLKRLFNGSLNAWMVKTRRFDRSSRVFENKFSCFRHSGVCDA